MINIKHCRNSFYFYITNSKNQITLEGQYSSTSGLWIYKNGKYVSIKGVFVKC